MGRQAGREGGSRPNARMEDTILQGISHLGLLVNVEARINCQATAKMFNRLEDYAGLAAKDAHRDSRAEDANAPKEGIVPCTCIRHSEENILVHVCHTYPAFLGTYTWGGGSSP